MQQATLNSNDLATRDTHHMDKDIEQLISDLATQLGQTVPPFEQKQAEQFVHLFYTNPAREMLTRMKADEIVKALHKVWEFYKVKDTDEPKWRIYHWKPEVRMAFADRIVIDIVSKNQSFSLDSVYGLLSRFGTKSRVSFHPIISVTRDEKGLVQSLAKPKHDGENETLESIIHIEIVDHISDDLIANLEKELPGVLLDVQRANEDWLPMRRKALEAVADLKAMKGTTAEPDTLDEIINFVEWIENDHFTFLGYCNYDLDANETEKIAHRVDDDTPLGILKDEEVSRLQTLFAGIALNDQSKEYIFDKFPIIINKTSVVSKVHRSVCMDCIGVRRFDAQGTVIGMRIFVGLFTSVAYDSSARDIPLLRTKIKKIVNRAGFTYDWHEGKALIHILDSLPRDEVFQASITELSDIGLQILRLQERRHLAFFVRRDQFNRFLSCWVYIPRDRFDTDLCDRMGEILSHEFSGTIGAYKAQYGELAYARVHYTIHAPAGLKDHYDLDRIEQLLRDEARSWADDLKSMLMTHYQEIESASLYRKYKKAFNKGYQERYNCEETFEDIKEIESLYKKDGDFRVRIFNMDDQQPTFLKLKLYHYGSPLPLSDVLPILENLDLRVMSEVPFEVSPVGEDERVWIHDFSLESRGGCLIDIEGTCRKFEETLLKVRAGDVENDGFNRLVLRAGLDCRQCALFRAYAKYIRLIGLPFSKAYLVSALVRNPGIVKDLNALFIARFCPDNHNKDAEQKARETILDCLDAITNADDDRVLRLYMTVMTATVRTNFFQTIEGRTASKDYMSFKISSRDIEEMPKPRPLYEIFVYSSYMEGVHLRGGKVARGGIRWSDRHEDFRTEVLNLVKAQMVKNTVIIPVGSKGGFIVKQSTVDLTREAFMDVGVRCYRSFIRGLLDLTDNLKGGGVVHPHNVVRHDDDDTYLVVAADKGTATFSDFANEISEEYDFWLGDAFASGGSVGYDHKKMGITATGAWESVKRHFREQGKDIQNDDFTVIGVGDMSGDVFGNGMLLSQHIRLLSAFNHMHIFVDPNPNAEISFKERERLFRMPRSSWADYDPKLLSQGAQIYNRHDKILTLTPEIQEMLGCHETMVKPDALIQMLLKHNAELLWFGGIGTYIKASTEGRNDVGDRANDTIRVDAKDLRVQVIGEGANLAMTQLGRIEFERIKGGRLNTDAIDNSAGVSCSDREVNIKILFNALVRKGSLKVEERNKILLHMTKDVSELVLRDNYLQPQTITDILHFGNKNFDQQVQLLRKLEQDGVLDRQLEQLPDDVALEEYQNAQRCFSRPEFAVILGYSKIYFYDQILASSLPEDPYFENHLLAYFPPLMREQYRQEILMHPLRREIIATYVVNALVNRMGPSFINLAITTTNASIKDVCMAYFTVCEVFNIRNLWENIEKLDCNIPEQSTIGYRLTIYKIIKRTVLWLLRYYPMGETISETSSVLSIGIDSFLAHMEDTLHVDLKQKIESEIQQASHDGLPIKWAHRLAILEVVSTSPDIILIANETKYTVPEVAELYFCVGQKFFFSTLRETLDTPVFHTNAWDRRLSSSMIEDLYNYQSDLTINILRFAERENIAHDDHFDTVISDWERAHHNVLTSIRNMIKEGQIDTKPDLTVISLILRELRVFSGAH